MELIKMKLYQKRSGNLSESNFRAIGGYVLDEVKSTFLQGRIDVHMVGTAEDSEPFMLSINQLGLVIGTPVAAYSIEQATRAFKDIEDVCGQLGLRLTDDMIDWSVEPDSSKSRGTLPMPTVQFTAETIVITPPRFHFEGFSHYLETCVDGANTQKDTEGICYIDVGVENEDKSDVIGAIQNAYAKYLTSQDCEQISFDSRS